jgi:hypothetical protein
MKSISYTETSDFCTSVMVGQDLYTGVGEKVVTLDPIESPKFISQVETLSKKAFVMISERNQALLLKESTLGAFVMKNPSKEVVVDIKSHYNDLAKLFIDYNIEADDLEYILWATPEARCTFSIKYSPDKKHRLKMMKAFLADLKSGHIERSINVNNFSERTANLESILTAIGYRSIGPGWVLDDKDEQGKTIERPNNVRAICNSGVSSYLISSLGEDEFPKRSDDDADLSAKDSIVPRRELEDSYLIPTQTQAKIDEHSIDPPQEGLAPRCFTKVSYVAQGIDTGIAMRAHTSGSAPLSFAALNFIKNYSNKSSKIMIQKGLETTKEREPIYKGAQSHLTLADTSKNKGPSTLFVNLSEIESQRFKGILVASYILGDYHSFAETMAGAAHYEQQMIYDKYHSKQGESIEIYRNTSKNRLVDLSPKCFLGLAAGSLMEIISTESKVQSEFNHLLTDILEEAT